MKKQEIPEPVLKNAIERLRGQGFKHRVELQAQRMISETTEIVEAIGGRIVWDGE